MAAGDAFTLTPNEVVPVQSEYNNVQSQTESMKKEYFQVSATPVDRYKLFFKVLSDAERQTLENHNKDQSDDYFPFSWTSVPNYINGGSNITGRWVKKSLDMTPIQSGKWKCSITFEKAN